MNDYIGVPILVQKDIISEFGLNYVNYFLFKAIKFEVLSRFFDLIN